LVTTEGVRAGEKGSAAASKKGERERIEQLWVHAKKSRCQNDGGGGGELIWGGGFRKKVKRRKLTLGLGWRVTWGNLTEGPQAQGATNPDLSKERENEAERKKFLWSGKLKKKKRGGGS